MTTLTTPDQHVPPNSHRLSGCDISALPLNIRLIVVIVMAARGASLLSECPGCFHSRITAFRGNIPVRGFISDSNLCSLARPSRNIARPSHHAPASNEDRREASEIHRPFANLGHFICLKTSRRLPTYRTHKPCGAHNHILLVKPNSPSQQQHIRRYREMKHSQTAQRLGVIISGLSF